MPRLLGSVSPARSATLRRFAVASWRWWCRARSIASRASLARNEPAKSLINPCPHIRHLWTRNLTIARAVRMLEPKVMDITVAIDATRNHAAPIATPDQTSHLGRNVLRGARSAWSLTPMGAKVEPLRVAVCHGDNIWR